MSQDPTMDWTKSISLQSINRPRHNVSSPSHEATW